MAEDTALTLDVVRQRVKRLIDVDAAAGDGPTAHIHEDDLYTDILRMIAGSSIAMLDPVAIGWVEMCEEALKTQDVDFDRWYA